MKTRPFRFYRNAYQDDMQEHRGFSWHRSRVLASQAAAEARRSDVVVKTVGEPIDVTPTKAGILRVLEGYAVHPDNG